MKKYVKKPIVISAIQYTGDVSVLHELKNDYNAPIEIDHIDGHGVLTLEGKMFISEGDYIIRGVDGEFYPCKPSIFEKTYDVHND